MKLFVNNFESFTLPTFKKSEFWNLSRKSLKTLSCWGRTALTQTFTCVHRAAIRGYFHQRAEPRYEPKPTCCPNSAYLQRELGIMRSQYVMVAALALKNLHISTVNKHSVACQQRQALSFLLDLPMELNFYTIDSSSASSK